MEDPYVREKEVEFLIEEIQRYYLEQRNPLHILDAGCGNAYTLSRLKEHFPEFSFLGVEFTPELYELARERNLERVEIIHQDLRCADFCDQVFDVAYTERALINILDRSHQEVAAENIIRRIKNDGLLIVIESFKEPLVELNQARSEMCLEEIKQSYQNRYLDEGFIRKILRMGMMEITPLLPSNYLSTHFYLTRVFHKAIRPEGGKVKYTKMVGFFDKALPPAVGNFSPILFRVFKKFITS